MDLSQSQVRCLLCPGRVENMTKKNKKGTTLAGLSLVLSSEYLMMDANGRENAKRLLFGPDPDAPEILSKAGDGPTGCDEIDERGAPSAPLSPDPETKGRR